MAQFDITISVDCPFVVEGGAEIEIAGMQFLANPERNNQVDRIRLTLEANDDAAAELRAKELITNLFALFSLMKNTRCLVGPMMIASAGPQGTVIERPGSATRMVLQSMSARARISLSAHEAKQWHDALPPVGDLMPVSLYYESRLSEGHADQFRALCRALECFSSLPQPFREIRNRLSHGVSVNHTGQVPLLITNRDDAALVSGNLEQLRTLVREQIRIHTGI